MIQPQDLRIGNYVWEDYGGEYEVRGVLLESNYKLTGVNIGKPGVKTTGSVLLTALKPIELTEQWLRDFGFVKRSDHEFTSPNRRIRLWGYAWDFEAKFASGKWVKLNYEPIKYVHQLQNLYFALTSSELVRK